MSDPLTINDLRVVRWHPGLSDPIYNTLSPAEFADIARQEVLGGIDVERVRRGVHLLYECIRPIGGPPRDLLNDTLDALDAVLDALTPEEDT